MTADLPLPETLLGVTVPRAPLMGDSGARRSAWPAVAPEAQTVEQGTSGSRRRVLAADPPPPDCPCKVGTRRAEQGRPAYSRRGDTGPRLCAFCLHVRIFLFYKDTVILNKSHLNSLLVT